MALSGDVIRDRIIRYIDENGCKQAWISKETGIPTYVLCRYLKGEKALNDRSLNVLNDLLVNRGY